MARNRDQAPTGRGRRRARRLLLTFGVTALLLGGWGAAPGVGYRVRVHLADRAIAGGRLDDARERLDTLILEEPARTLPRFLLARVARLQGRITEAEEVLQRAVELGLPVEEARVEHDSLPHRP